MSNTKHTSEPWEYVKANPSPTTGEHLIKSNAKPGYLAEMRDRRIVACVNWCEGLATERLEQAMIGAKDALEHAKHMKQQRDELLAALKRAHAYMDDIYAELLHNNADTQKAYQEGAAARASITNAEAHHG